MSTLNKDDVVKMFLRDELPVIKEYFEQDGIKDRPARSEGWNNFVDGLIKDGLVDADRAYNWSAPKACS